MENVAALKPGAISKMHTQTNRLMPALTHIIYMRERERERLYLYNCTVMGWYW